VLKNLALRLIYEQSAKASTLKSVALQRAVVRKMAADGLRLTVESNGVDYESM
jgi:hypothetical protein